MGRLLRRIALNMGEKRTYEPPKCPACGVPLIRVAENAYETYKFNPSTGCYEADGEAEIKCLECGADLYDVFPHGVCNYDPEAKPEVGQP